MNLAPRDLGPQQGTPGILALPTSWGSVGGALLLLGTLLTAFLDGGALGRRLEQASEEQASLAAELARRQQNAEAIESGRARISELEVSRARLLRWEEEKLLVSELLRGLALQVGSDVIIEELRREGGRIFIVGRTGAGSSAVAAAARSLGRVDRLQGLNLQWVEQIEDIRLPAGQRFSLAGAVRYFSPPPNGFGLTEPPVEAGS